MWDQVDVRPSASVLNREREIFRGQCKQLALSLDKTSWIRNPTHTGSSIIRETLKFMDNVHRRISCSNLIQSFSQKLTCLAMAGSDLPSSSLSWLRAYRERLGLELAATGGLRWMDVERPRLVAPTERMGETRLGDCMVELGERRLLCWCEWEPWRGDEGNLKFLGRVLFRSSLSDCKDKGSSN